MQNDAKAKLQELAPKCALGDADAMLELSAFYRSLEAGGVSDLWLLRAAMYGQAQAQGMVESKMRDNPRFLKNLPIPYENFLPGKRAHWYTGTYFGQILNAMGFKAFEPNGKYLLAGIDRDRVMIVEKLVDYDPPDEDGFGAEEYYDYFCLDEFFKPLPDVPTVRNLSSQGCRHSQEYDAMIDAMKEAARRREQVPLWTAFVPEKTI